MFPEMYKSVVNACILAKLRRKFIRILFLETALFYRSVRRVVTTQELNKRVTQQKFLVDGSKLDGSAFQIKGPIFVSEYPKLFHVTICNRRFGTGFMLKK